MPRLKLHWQILIAIVLACIAGTLTGTDAGLFGVTFYQAYDFVGTLFLNALKMITVPLIMAAIITGVSGVGGEGGLGRLGVKTVLYYMLTSTLAILVGLVLVNTIAPGILGGEPAGPRLGLGRGHGGCPAERRGQGSRRHCRGLSADGAAQHHRRGC